MGCRQEINLIMKLTRNRLPLNVPLEIFWRLLIGIKALGLRLGSQQCARQPPVTGAQAVAVLDTRCPQSEDASRRRKYSAVERRHLIKLAAKIRRKEWRSSQRARVRKLPTDDVVAAGAPSPSVSGASALARGESSLQAQSAHSSRGGRPMNPVPRHRRPSHIKAEFKRRGKIQNGFDTLKAVVPDISENAVTKESKASMLFKAADYCRQLKAEEQSMKEEEENLRKEIQQLHADIKKQQRLLPDGGMSVVQKPTISGEPAFKEYLKSRTALNWRFWIFSFIARPLFESYNSMVSISSPQAFFQTIMQWADQHLSLVNLRPIGIEALRQVSIQSSIMTDPKKVPEEALKKINAL